MTSTQNYRSKEFYTMLRKDLSVAIIDIPNFSEKTMFAGFFGGFGAVLTILGAQYMPEKQRLIGLYQQLDKSFFTVRDASQTTNSLTVEVGPKLGEFSTFYPQCMAYNQREDIVIMGGSNSKDSRMGEALVAIFKIESDKLTYIDDMMLESFDRNKSMATTAITRVMGTDIFFAGCFGSISLIEWTNIKLALLAKYSGAHTWLVTQISTSSEEFFSLCKNDKFLVYDRINLSGF